MSDRVEIVYWNNPLSHTSVVLVPVGEMNFLRYVFRPVRHSALYGLFVCLCVIVS